MIKRIFLALTLLLIGAPAYAQEINADANCTNSSLWTVNSHGSGTWTTGSGCVGASVSAMKMLMQMNSAVKAGHRYKLTFTVGSYSAGQVRGFVGLSMPSAPTGSWITAASTPDIADNFTTSLGLQSGTAYTLGGPGNSLELGGAWRFGCSSAGWGYIDPVVYPGLGSPHLHEFYGASNVGKGWTFSDFRAKAESTCGAPGSAKAPYAANRSGYWIPAMMDGVGNVKRASTILVYYKGPASPTANYGTTITGSISGTTLTVTSIAAGSLTYGLPITGSGITAGTTISSQLTGTEGSTGTYVVNNSQTVASETITVGCAYTGVGGCSAAQADCANHSPTTDCPEIPTGLRMTFGYRSSDGKCGPLDSNFADASCSLNPYVYASLECWGGPNNEGGPKGTNYTGDYHTLADIMASGLCVKGSWLHVGLGFPDCWDRVNVDSPDHRSHINYGNGSDACTASFPARLTAISIQAYYLIDDAFIAGKWHLASDEMATGCYNGTTLVAVTAGCTMHGDYFEAWSPTVRHKWFLNCVMAHNSCTQDIGDGTQIPTGATNFDGTIPPGNGYQLARPDDKSPLTKFGMTTDVSANGTYTFYLDCPADMNWGFFGLNGFSGTITGISLQDVGVTAKGPVTVHN